jgi:hypothetical protein
MPALTANAYLGGRGITAALEAGADVVITGRVTDAALVVGPAAWWHGWDYDDAASLDALAGAVAAGHVIECGAQATGGNYAFFAEVPGLEHVGFPWAEVAHDGSSVIGKHDGTGGLVSVGTVTAQLLYEIGRAGVRQPDVTARFDTLELAQAAPDRVAITGVRGEPAPDTVKVALNTLGGFRNSASLVLTGLDIEAKADTVRPPGRRSGLAEPSRQTCASFRRHPEPPMARSPSGKLHVSVKAPDERSVGRAFSSAAIELASRTTRDSSPRPPPGRRSRSASTGPHWSMSAMSTTPSCSTTVAASASTRPPPVPPSTVELAPAPASHRRSCRLASPRDVVRRPIGRQGRQRERRRLGHRRRRVRLARRAPDRRPGRELCSPRPEGSRSAGTSSPTSDAVNFVIVGYLGEGVASSTAFDPQAKGLGEYLRSRPV